MKKSSSKLLQKDLDKVLRRHSVLVKTEIDLYCKKYNYSFSAGMGSWSFESSNGRNISDYDCEPGIHPAIKRLVKRLRKFDQISEYFISNL